MPAINATAPTNKINRRTLIGQQVPVQCDVKPAEDAEDTVRRA